jgi:WD40 repeat protein
VIELRGDEALAVFESPSQAIRAAIDLRAACLEEEAADPTLPLHVGIGIDSGDAVPVEEGYRGSALNRAARLCSAAGAGQVLASAQTTEDAGPLEEAEYVGRVVPAKGFDDGLEAFEITADAKLAPPTEPPSGVPIELEAETPLAGRMPELRWLRGTWRQARRGRGRVVFVSGSPAMGKTRLAAEIAAVAAVDGAEIAYAGAGGTAAAAALGLLRSAGTVTRPTLLVLDDLDSTAEQIEEALSAAFDPVEAAPALVVCLLRNPDSSEQLAALVARADRRGDGHRRLEPLREDDVREIARFYAGTDLPEVPVESIARTSMGVPARVHELLGEWFQQEAARRLEAAAEWLSDERRARLGDLEFANNVIGLRLARLYAAPGPDQEAGACPYKGLAPFEQADAGLFFGRERLVGELAARTVGSGLLAVVGASGSGKSSAIAAGLLPSLQAGLLPGSARWEQTSIRPGGHPMAELATVGLADERRVLVVDQLEELFTVCADEQERAAFVAALVELAGDPERTIVVVGIRGDHYGHFGAYPDLAALLAANQVLVGPMGPEELRRAVELPARRGGVRVESSLVGSIVTEIGSEPGGLPLLSTALVELWLARSDGWIRLEDHDRLGGIHGAVARLAEGSFEQLGQHEQEHARRLFLRLATVDDEGMLARRRVALAELDLERDPVAATVVDRLTADRLLTAHEGAVEIAHEALLREWPRYQEWLAEDAQGRELREHVIRSARRWQEGEDEAELYRGARLSAAQDWAALHAPELNELERRFLAESRAQSEHELQRQRRTNRRLKALLAGVGALLVVAIGAGGVALVARSHANHEATVALGRQLGAEAVSNPQIDLSMLLAEESLRLDRSLQTEGTLLATLLREPALIGSFSVPITDRPQRVEVAPDGRTIAVVTNQQVMRVFDVRTHRQIKTIPLANFGYAYVPGTDELVAGGTGALPMLLVDARTGRVMRKLVLSRKWLTTYTNQIEPLVVSPDGRFAFLIWASLKPDGTPGPAYAERWSLARGGPSQLIPLHVDDVTAAVVTPDDRLVVASEGRISSWDAATMRHLGSSPGPAGALSSAQMNAAALSSDGSLYAYGLPNGQVWFYDVARRKTIAGLSGHTASVRSLAFSPDSRRAVSAGDDDIAIVWDSRTGAPIARLTGHSGRVANAAFSPDSKTIYTASLDGRVLQWDNAAGRGFGAAFTAGPPIGPVSGDDPYLIQAALAFAPDGRTFAAHTGGPLLSLFSTDDLRRTATISAGRGDNASATAWAGPSLLVGDAHSAIERWTLAGHPKLASRLVGLATPGIATGQARCPVCGDAPVRAIATARNGALVAAVNGYYGPVPKDNGPLPELGALAIWNGGRLVSGRALPLGTFGDAVAFAPDGSLLAVATDDGRVLVVDPSTGLIERTIRPAGGTFSLAFSPDGTLATGSHAGIVQLWNPDNGTQVGHQLLVAESPVTSIAFDPTGATFVTTGGTSGTARLWETATEQQLGADLPGGGGSSGSAAFTPDGKQLVVDFTDGAGVRWPTSVGAWEQHACAVAGRNFTREEWARFVGGRPYADICPGSSSRDVGR